MKVLLISNVYLMSSENSKISNFVTDQVYAMGKYCPDVEYTIYTIRGRDSKWNYLRSLNEIKKIINRNQFDLIHVHYGLSGLFLLFIRNVKIPVVLTFHGGDILKEQGHFIQVYLSKKIVARCKAAITLNKRMDEIVKHYNSTTRIIPCSINLDFFKPSDFPQKHGQVKRIIFPSSRIRPEKNWPLFEQTIGLLRTKYGYEINVVEFNNISKQKVSEYYRDCDLLLLTSISEGSPGVVKEAMASNLAVVSTNVGDVQENLHGVRGCAVAQTMDANELAELCDKSLKEQINGVWGRNKIEALGLDDETICYRLYEFYKTLIIHKNDKE